VVGTPHIIDLAFENGSISQANNIKYLVKFDFGGDESILSIDKGSFDDAVKRDAETIIFNANNLSQNQNKSGVVILSAENNNISKAVIYTNLTINGITRSDEIDPAGPSILSIATEIIDLVDKGFKTATSIANQITPCINLNSSASDPQPEDDKAQYLVEVINCSNNFQNFRLSPHLPRDSILLKLDTPFDLPKDTAENKTLIIGVAPTMEEMDYPFGVNGSVILKLFNTEYEVASARTSNFFEVNHTNDGKVIAIS
jgi:hypothetical protein